MNATVIRLTARTLLGRRRIWLLLALPVVLLVLAAVVRALVGADDDVAWAVASGFGVATLVPLVALLAGTGSIGAEIDDGSIVYLLTKPISRFTIVISKLAVAVVTALLAGPVPVAVAALVLAESPSALVAPLALAAAAAAAAYCVLFLLLSILTRNAVIVGLLYAIVWETTVGGFIPGAQALSVRQWALALAERLLGSAEADRLGVDAAVGPAAGGTALAVVVVAGTVYAGLRLRSIRLSTAE